jgi:polyphosphate kinase
VPGLSERVQAISIVDRYLEHARAFYFENGGCPEYLLSSADWMPRNLDRRVEIAFPILDPALQAAVKTVLETQLADTVKARVLLPDGRFAPRGGDGRGTLRSQERLWDLTREIARA